MIVKSYVCFFVSLTDKAMHLEPVSDLTSDAFVAALCRFTARRGKPTSIVSDRDTNFVGGYRELKEMYNFLNSQKTKGEISDFCSTHIVTYSGNLFLKDLPTLVDFGKRLCSL